MGKKEKTAISPTRAEDYPEWYQQVVRAADLAEPSPVRGCMVIKPWGYALWENIRDELDRMFKATGHVNAYFPLFIPLSYLEKEAEHVEGFAKECAVVTHRRLEIGPDGGLVPSGKLDEPLVVRPTSETIIGATYAKWVQSYRDLPILINQWANVVRWEMRPRLFLRTTEFLWQEGHTAHETRDEAWQETLQMLDVYTSFAEDYMAMPVIAGEKSKGERFPGAVNTFSIEAMMQDRKALQAGTSHFLGQNFAKASKILYLGREGKQEHAWTTSWGVSTRLIGGMVMTHADDNGMRMPPRLAPSHVAILPVTRSDDDCEAVLSYCDEIKAHLESQTYAGKAVKVELDTRELNAGEKSWDWIKKGIPIIAEVGPREVENSNVFVGRRDQSRRDRQSLHRDEFCKGVDSLLGQIQDGMFTQARTHLDAHTTPIADWGTMTEYFTPSRTEKPEIHGGFARSPWCGRSDCERKANEDIAISIRCIPTNGECGDGRCVVCGETSTSTVIFAKTY